MTPHYADDWLTVYGGDCRTVLATLPEQSVHCVVTSPPYWGLRDYGTATWSGGDEGCDHSAGSHAWATPTEQAKKRVDSSMPFRGVCGRCGASRTDSQLGLEATPEEYVANLVDVFREVRRVLRDDGTLWLNLGDSYFGTGRGPSNGEGSELGYQASMTRGGSFPTKGIYSHATLKGKDLVGIPWRVAFALQADGWYLRSDIIWAKPNPMPESVTDRPTKAHEYLFLLSKSARYYFDQEAVREEAVSAGEVRGGGGKASTNGIHANRSDGQNLDRLGRLPTASGRNLRSVWTIATRPYPGAHFAVFPSELPERCIKAGSSEGGVVLDPFAGSGTVGLVANRLSRRAVLIDLNPSYLEQQMQRNAQTPMGLAL